ncbi:MAG TPA: crosslink repair DNA glycosylase YcaQ family protein [Casimicrobiaceae bacterium]|nr:crosslink repair DNA glycosylase YcaQ family protein [Casimicrobiaceae bacterium]
MSAAVRLADLRRYAIARSLFAPVNLQAAIDRLGFVQADPIRAPARAQDLALRHRVVDYRAGDLDRAYPALAVEEDFFVNYGFVSRDVYALMHPRRTSHAWSDARRRRARAVLAFVSERGFAHPRDVEARFAHGAVVNAWGGSSNATTHLLDAMHYRGALRVVRREAGIRVYGVRGTMRPYALPPGRRLDALVDVLVAQYAPLPARSLSTLVRRLRYAAPQLARGIDAALARANRRLSHASVDGTEWYWPTDEAPLDVGDGIDGEARLLAPFDPIVWDRARFERFFGWAYRFEAYTPPTRRKLGYYALPLLFGDAVIGWGNVTMNNGRLARDIGYVRGKPRGRAYSRALERELTRMQTFLAPPPDG